MYKINGNQYIAVLTNFIKNSYDIQHLAFSIHTLYFIFYNQIRSLWTKFRLNLLYHIDEDKAISFLLKTEIPHAL